VTIDHSLLMKQSLPGPHDADDIFKVIGSKVVVTGNAF